jgi:hypothetical protein
MPRPQNTYSSTPSRQRSSIPNKASHTSGVKITMSAGANTGNDQRAVLAQKQAAGHSQDRHTAARLVHNNTRQTEGTCWCSAIQASAAPANQTKVGAAMPSNSSQISCLCHSISCASRTVTTASTDWRPAVDALSACRRVLSGVRRSPCCCHAQGHSCCHSHVPRHSRRCHHTHCSHCNSKPTTAQHTLRQNSWYEES